MNSLLPVHFEPRRVIGWSIVVVLLAWSYGGVMWGLAYRWWDEPDYVYGFLVPPFAGLLLWTRREMMPVAPEGRWWGLGLLVVAGGLRALGAYLQIAALDPLSLVPCLAGIAVLAGGLEALRWSWPAIVYLVFMIPLPGFMAPMLSGPLQSIGATTSTYILQTLGIPADVRGNIISLSSGWQLGVEEACSGLRMLMLFLAVGAGAALLMQRPAWERLVLILSAAPIAVIANVVRITVTGVLYETAGPEWAEMVFHDLAGFFMMPLAVLLLWLEMGLLSLLFRPSWEDADWEEW